MNYLILVIALFLIKIIIFLLHTLKNYLPSVYKFIAFLVLATLIAAALELIIYYGLQLDEYLTKTYLRPFDDYIEKKAKQLKDYFKNKKK